MRTQGATGRGQQGGGAGDAERFWQAIGEGEGPEQAKVLAAAARDQRRGQCLASAGKIDVR